MHKIVLNVQVLALQFQGSLNLREYLLWDVFLKTPIFDTLKGNLHENEITKLRMIIDAISSNSDSYLFFIHLCSNILYHRMIKANFRGTSDNGSTSASIFLVFIVTKPLSIVNHRITNCKIIIIIDIAIFSNLSLLIYLVTLTQSEF